MHFHQGQYNLYHYLSLVLWKSYLRISSKPKQCPPISAHTFAKQKTKCFYGYKTRQWTPVALWASMLFRLKNIEIDWKIPWLYKSCLSESSMVSPWKKIAVLWTRTKMECLRNSWTYGHTHWTFLRPQLFILCMWHEVRLAMGWLTELQPSLCCSAISLLKSFLFAFLFPGKCQRIHRSKNRSWHKDRSTGSKEWLIWGIGVRTLYLVGSKNFRVHNYTFF